MSTPLVNRTIAVLEGRESEALAGLFEELGASCLRCPLIDIVDSDDSQAVRQWLTQLCAGQFDDVILLTGEGLRRLLGFAERLGCRDAAIAALAETRTITRGPKPARALTEVGLSVGLAAPAPTVDGICQLLQSLDLAGRCVGLQSYDRQEQTELVECLRSRGASVAVVFPYRYAPAAPDDQVVRLLEAIAAGQVDAITFTSAPQVDRLVAVAEQSGMRASLSAALARTAVAAVGPIVQRKLDEQQLPCHLVPPRSYFMKTLVRQIVERFTDPPPA